MAQCTAIHHKSVLVGYIHPKDMNVDLDNNQITQRNYKIDNIRCILIFLVVLAHLLEKMDGAWATNAYSVIYSFHMPIFVFITGYLARFKPKKIFSTLLYPYVLFQLLYTIVTNKQIQFTTPHWIMWYLFATIVYYCLIPLINTDRIVVRIVIVVATVTISLVAGFDNNVGYFLSLSRILTFLPYFVVGFYIKSASTQTIKLYDKFKRYNYIVVIVSAVLVVLSSCFVCLYHVDRKILYGSYSYELAHYSIWLKALLLVIAFCWIIFFWRVMPNKKITVFSNLGANTLSIYLLHGFVVYLVRAVNLFTFTEALNILLAIVIALAVMFLFGNKAVCWFVNNICTGRWIERLYNDYKIKKDIQ